MNRATWLMLTGVLIWIAAAGAAALKKPARRPRVSPRVSAARKAAAVAKAKHYLEDSASQCLRQPGALVPAFEQLYLAASESHTPMHILHFGDSHTAADELTNELRQRFQEAFGAGGSGFSLAGHPFPGYRRSDAIGGGTLGWHTQGLATASGDGWFGLGGVSITTMRAHQSVHLDTQCDQLEIDYLQQPGGGEVAFYSDDALVDRFSTDGEMAPGFHTEEVSPGPHRVRLETLDSRPVRLFGWVADKNSGVSYEALGINGAEAGLMLKWNRDMLATYLQRRNPGLIVLAYGTNEASDANWSQASYQAMYSELLQELRAAAPAASILVLGPTDRWQRRKGQWRIVPGIDDIIAAQRKAARENRCAFWDARARMGGKGSMLDWVNAGWAQLDHVHFTAEGYRRLGAALYEDLMEQYDIYKKTRSETNN
jgi:lysophospholipase L1-like esterase